MTIEFGSVWIGKVCNLLILNDLLCKVFLILLKVFVFDGFLPDVCLKVFNSFNNFVVTWNASCFLCILFLYVYSDVDIIFLAHEQSTFQGYYILLWNNFFLIVYMVTLSHCLWGFLINFIYELQIIKKKKWQ